MSYTRRVTISSRKEMSVRDNSCSEARAHADINKVGAVLTGSKIILTQRIQIGIFLNPNGQVRSKAFVDFFSQMRLFPAKIDRIIYHTAIRIDFTGRSNANADYSSGRLRKQFLNLIRDPVHDGSHSIG